ncbi:MAG: adenylyltransferase/cytidyltransferase family protein, partial [Cyclobacteriaceae bacterium]|nr:adenylyltransferase/cytidyltransferase family protein [Cyclobacteriaceae bacterium]
MQSQNKIKEALEAAKIVKHWQDEGFKIVFTNGCFDLLHLGHIDYLEKARNLGDKLVIGVNTDQSIKRLKGENRPITDERSRSRLLSAMEFVDLVILFDTDTPYELIKLLKPDFLVKGNDYLSENIIGSEIVRKSGGSIETIPL